MPHCLHALAQVSTRWFPARALVTGAITAMALLLPAAPARAQPELLAAWMARLASYVVPTELSLGVGSVLDQVPSQWSAAVDLGFARAYGRDEWIEPALDLGYGPTSDEALCQDEGPVAIPDTCMDGYIVAGARFRPLRQSDRARRPFLHVLLGGYWKGTGVKEPETLPANVALQIGGGIDFRRATSIHGLRLSGDYRRVFAGDQGRHQWQFLAAYFVGSRGWVWTP